MSTATAVLRVGSMIHHDGQVWSVVEFAGRRLLLARAAGSELRQVDIGWLLTHPSTHVSASSAVLPSPGGAFDGLDAGQADELRVLAQHLQELLTGYRLGDKILAQPGEPRPPYRPTVSKMERYRAKAAELGVGESTLRRWAAAFDKHGPAALLPQGGMRLHNPFGRIDTRWLDACRQVLDAHVNGSRPTRALILAQTEAALAEQHGPGVVPIPCRTVAYEALRAMTKGTNAFTGATKAKRSIASRPPAPYRRLRATRPGEYVLLDTNRLDVYAMEPITCRWVQCELTTALDLYSRCLAGLRLTPVSTKAVDVAGVLYETVRPQSRPDIAALPHVGVPDTVVVDAAKLVDHQAMPLLPSVAAETVVYDHGQIFLSEHMRSVCARLGVSLQPARPGTATDKAVLERWFATLNDGLLVALPGYKGADVHSRGLDVEAQAFFFLDELETIIRQWIGEVYHRRPHDGLCVPQIPGLAVSPLEMLEHGITRAGHLTILDHPDLAYAFLQVRWTTIQHYGVEIDTLRYDGPAIGKYANTPSPYGGVHAGKWPFSIDPGDITRIFFCDPHEHRWHTCWWEHAAALGQPLSGEAMSYARRLAATRHRFPDTKQALAELLQRWGAGLTESAAERRMALRLSQQRLQILPDPPERPAPRPPSAEPAQGGHAVAFDPARSAHVTDPAAFYADVMDIA